MYKIVLAFCHSEENTDHRVVDLSTFRGPLLYGSLLEVLSSLNVDSIYTS